MILEEILAPANLHKIRIRIGILQRITTFGQQRSRIVQILPIDPGAAVLHDGANDPRSAVPVIIQRSE